MSWHVKLHSRYFYFSFCCCVFHIQSWAVKSFEFISMYNNTREFSFRIFPRVLLTPAEWELCLNIVDGLFLSLTNVVRFRHFSINWKCSSMESYPPTIGKRTVAGCVLGIEGCVVAQIFQHYNDAAWFSMGSKWYFPHCGVKEMFGVGTTDLYSHSRNQINAGVL